MKPASMPFRLDACGGAGFLSVVEAEILGYAMDKEQPDQLPNTVAVPHREPDYPETGTSGLRREAYPLRGFVRVLLATCLRFRASGSAKGGSFSRIRFHLWARWQIPRCSPSSAARNALAIHGRGCYERFF
jgi:hypothetical protein